ncbi:MAG: CBS domain-containing protein [Anaerolineaceae bacterium]
MAYLSELIGNPVTDLDGVRVGKLRDLVAIIKPEVSHPVVVAIVADDKGANLVIPYSDVVVLLAPAIPLKVQKSQIAAYLPGERDIFLAQDVLDKQIIDTDDIRVVRVNDVELVRANGSVVASNVDISTMGILRRIGLGHAGERMMNLLHRPIKHNVISWDDVDLLSREQVMRLRVPGDKISSLHPADLANILSDMNRAQSTQFLDSLNLSELADTLEEVEEDFQVSLVENMPDEKVADVLEEMSPDEAADLLAELPEERSKKLIDLMEDEEAEDVRRLLGYPEDSAGGLMTTEYVAIRPGLTAEQAIEELRKSAGDAETIYYVYITDENGALLGVISLSDLILAQPATPVDDFMHRRVVSVKLDEDQDTVAQLISRYNLLAVPVVDEQNILQGIVTSDDALDRIIPTVWKKRLPRYYR